MTDTLYSILVYPVDQGAQAECLLQTENLAEAIRVAAVAAWIAPTAHAVIRAIERYSSVESRAILRIQGGIWRAGEDVRWWPPADPQRQRAQTEVA